MTILTMTTLTSIFSLFAVLTGKQHKNVMQAIRNMEPAWKKMWVEFSADIQNHRSA